MTQASVKLSFDDYLTYDDGTDDRYEFVDGELLQMTPATHRHRRISRCLEEMLRQEIIKTSLRWETARNGEVGMQTRGKTKITVRLPDVVVFEGETVTDPDGVAILTVPPLFIVEVVSPGEQNRKRDYEQKSREYQSVGIPKYWIVDSQEAAQRVTVLILVDGVYEETEFVGYDRILSMTFPNLNLTAEQVLTVS